MSFDVYQWLLYSELIFAPVVLVLLLFVSAPYGRHHRPGWGPVLDQRWSWIIMELPAVILPVMFVLVFFSGYDTWRTHVLLLWLLHYIYRSIIFPLGIKNSEKSFPVAISLMALLFNVMNAYINWYAITVLNLGRDAWTPVAVAGAVIFIAGWLIHVSSDRIILRLRKDGAPRYSIPQGGMFRWVSSPNYLGEIIQWCGFALMVGTLAGLAFALFTIANLLPRAVANHAWYTSRFSHYPAERRKLIPGIF